MVDDLTRNNWIVIIIALTAASIFATNILIFNNFISDAATHISDVVDQTSRNMTELTTVLIELQRADIDTSTKLLDNFTDIMAQYSIDNNVNLDNISSLLQNILMQGSLPTQENNLMLMNLTTALVDANHTTNNTR